MHSTYDIHSPTTADVFISDDGVAFRLCIAVDRCSREKRFAEAVASGRVAPANVVMTGWFTLAAQRVIYSYKTRWLSKDSIVADAIPILHDIVGRRAAHAVQSVPHGLARPFPSTIVAYAT